MIKMPGDRVQWRALQLGGYLGCLSHVPWDLRLGLHCPESRGTTWSHQRANPDIVPAGSILGRFLWSVARDVCALGG